MSCFQLGVNFLDETESNLSDRGRGEFGKPNPQAVECARKAVRKTDPLFWTLLAIAGTAVLRELVLGFEGHGSRA
jgi:hypothetical protein